MSSPRRGPITTTVLRTERVTPHVVRVVVGGEAVAGMAVGAFTDHYVKLVLPPAGVRYDEPWDPEQVAATRPAHEQPVRRTYTVRDFDAARAELTIDFVVHGDTGVAGPWAASARPGDRLRLVGPGGAHAPDAAAPWHLLVGDEAALPAVAATLARLPAGVPAVAVLDVADAAEEQELRTDAALTVRWLHRDSGEPDRGGAVLAALAELDLPTGVPQAFVHGEAALVRTVRRWARSELGVPREGLSASGYWRRGRTEEGWREDKSGWAADVERDDAALPATA